MNISFVNTLASDIADSLYNDPCSWVWAEAGSHFAIKHHSGVRLMYEYSPKVLSPHPVNFGFFDRRKIKRALRSWRRVHGSRAERVQMLANARLTLDLFHSKKVTPLRRAS